MIAPVTTCVPRIHPPRVTRITRSWSACDCIEDFTSFCVASNSSWSVSHWLFSANSLMLLPRLSSCSLTRIAFDGFCHLIRRQTLPFLGRRCGNSSNQGKHGQCNQTNHREDYACLSEIANRNLSRPQPVPSGLSPYWLGRYGFAS